MTYYWKTDKYKISHAGWLLAASSPTNIAKGLEILARLTTAQQKKALAHRDELLAIYAKV